ncbi:MAG: NTP transferase domain-containing protein, partial [Pseudomonadota bacterium]
MSAAFPPAIPRSVAALDPAVQGVILAGGRATRMGGGDKALRTLAGRSMLAHLIERFAPQLPKGESDLVLNANGDPARFASYGLEVVADQVGEDAEAREGPLAGILAGLERAAARGRPF